MLVWLRVGLNVMGLICVGLIEERLILVDLMSRFDRVKLVQ